MIRENSELTDYVEVDKVTPDGLRGDLALIHAGVAQLRPLDVQYPVIRLGPVRGLEPLVRRVRVAAHRQDMQIPMSYPGYLNKSQTQSLTKDRL